MASRAGVRLVKFCQAVLTNPYKPFRTFHRLCYRNHRIGAASGASGAPPLFGLVWESRSPPLAAPIRSKLVTIGGIDQMFSQLHAGRLFGSLFVLALLLARGWAQTETGQITGKVTDPSGATIA